MNDSIEASDILDMNKVILQKQTYSKKSLQNSSTMCYTIEVINIRI